MSFYPCFLENKKRQRKRRALIRYNRKHGKIGFYSSMKSGRIILDGRAVIGLIWDDEPTPIKKTDEELGFKKIEIAGVKTLRKTYA